MSNMCAWRFCGAVALNASRGVSHMPPFSHRYADRLEKSLYMAMFKSRVWCIFSYSRCGLVFRLRRVKAFGMTCASNMLFDVNSPIYLEQPH